MACNDRECAVCYSEDGPFRKLGCGHEFCGGCIKQWYSKGTGTGCPMCRRPIYFKGFHKVREEWDDDHWRNKCLDVIEEFRSSLIADAFETAAMFTRKKWRESMMDNLVDDLKDLDRTTRLLMDEGIDSTWLDFILNETDDYYSDRHVGKWTWANDPVKPFETKYPKVAKSGAKGTRRARAPSDQFGVVIFLIQV
jgi:hypothetical protein